MKLLLTLMVATAQAAPFADPFRPPRLLDAPAAERAAPAATTRLESVLIGPDRRIAVINGQQYREGARFGSGRVLHISEAEVVIRHADRDEALKLFPHGVRK